MVMEAAKVEVTPEQRVREIDEELPRLEEQRESAAGKIQGADRRSQRSSAVRRPLRSPWSEKMRRPQPKTTS